MFVCVVYTLFIGVGVFVSAIMLLAVTQQNVDKAMSSNVKP